MIILDEDMLTYEALCIIARDYGIKLDPCKIGVDEYIEILNRFVEEHQFDREEMIDKIVETVKDGLKIEIKMK